MRIELGSLYRLIARLLATDMIAEAQSTDHPPHAGKKRRAYAITELGLAVARAEAELMRDTLAQVGAEKLLAGFLLERRAAANDPMTALRVD